MTTDDNIGAVAGYKAQLAAGFGKEGWSESPLIGLPTGAASLNWSNFWIRYLPLRAFANMFHALTLIAGSLALGVYLFRKNLSLCAVLIAALAAFWVGSNFTLIYAGHIRKFSIVFLFCATLVCLDKLFETKRWSWGVIAGGMLGIMFLEQQDVALFFGLFAGAYALFLALSTARREGEAPANPRKSAVLRNFLRLFPVVIVALMICIGPVLSAYRQNVAGVVAMEQSRQEKWEFCTQWSQPPEEIIDFIAPGYTGWRSGEPSGPYWGRMGRSAGWEQTRQGFMNFKLESTYLGIIPVLLAIFAIASSRGSNHRGVILFWGGAASVALLLSFGKYTPLYTLFWQLPVINNIRNPNKFIQIFQVSVAILAAFGLDAVLKNKASAKLFFRISLGVVAVLALWAFGGTINETGADFVRFGWPAEMAREIAGNRSAALWHATIMAAIAALVFAIPGMASLQKHANKILAGLVVLIIADAAWLSRHYVQKLPRGYIEENAVTRFLSQELGHQRTAMVSQGSFYNLWLTYLFPYHDIPHFNLTQMPRMPQDYQQFLGALQRNPVRMWQVSGVGFLLGPADVANQLPPGSYETAMRFDVMADAGGSLSVQENPQGQHAVFRALQPAPRFALVSRSEKVSDEQALAKMASAAWTPYQSIMLPLDSDAADLAESAAVIGNVEVLDHQPGYARLTVTASQPSYLRIGEKYDPGWRVFVGGKEAEVVRADFIFNAVEIPVGEHVVEIDFAPAGDKRWMSIAGLGLSLMAIVALVIPRRKPV